jgi:hypothetical protein
LNQQENTRSSTGVVSSTRPTPERLREAFYLDDAGELRWRRRSDRSKQWNTRYAHKLVGCVRECDGYRVCRFEGLTYLVHRIAWALTHGEWPAAKVQIDHKSGRRAQNHPNNLRASTHAQNNWNRPKYRNNRSGFKGVSFDKLTGRWRAIIRCNKIVHRLGRFATPEAAALAYNEAAHRLHGEFANLQEVW